MNSLRLYSKGDAAVTSGSAFRILGLVFLLCFAGACAGKQHAPAAPNSRSVLSSRSEPEVSAPQRRGQQASGTEDWPVFDHDPQRTGVNSDEQAISPNTVAGLQRLWTENLPEKADGSPILLNAIVMPDGTTASLLFMTTSHGTTLALNSASGDIVWQQTPPGPSIGGQPCQICATPAADPSGQWIYAAGNDAAIHRYATATGAEDQNSPWPVTVTLMNGDEKRSSSLNLANGYLYVAISGYNGDFGPYVGHVVAVHLADGATQVFNVLCSDQHQLLASPSVVPSTQASCGSREAGLWARSGVVVDQDGGPTAGNLFIASGNGPFDANRGGVDYGDSVMRLSLDASALLDSYTPTNYAQLNEGDIDLGSTAPVLLPQQTQSNTPYLAIQGGKDSIIRLLNRAALGGVGGELQQINLRAGDIFAAPLGWTDPQGNDPSGNNTWLFVDTSSALFGFRVVTDASGNTTLRQSWQVKSGGTSPILAGGVLFVAGSTGVNAYDPHNGDALWSTAQVSAGGNIGPIHWESPIVVNGVLYITDGSGQISAYGLPAQ